MHRRVVITGAGVICALGTSLDEFWNNCLLGHAVIEPIPQRWKDYATYKSSIWSPLPNIDFLERGITRIQRLQLDSTGLLTICAAKEAICNAGLSLVAKDKKGTCYSIEDFASEHTGVFMGTGAGGIVSCLDYHVNQVLAQPLKRLDSISAGLTQDELKASLGEVTNALRYPPRFNPFVVSMFIPSSVSALLGMHFSITGPNITYCQACASGTSSIGHAFHAIRNGHLDAALAGGVDIVDDYYGYIFRGYDAAGVLTKDFDDPNSANRPFDRARSGFLFSQGAAVVIVLEDMQTALKRGAPIIAEVIGFAETSDAHTMMSMEPDGRQIERMIRLALQDADLTAVDVRYVNAHGTGTLENDDIEADVISRVFGSTILVNSTKSLVGHTLGASGSLELVVAAMSLKHQTTHICKNLQDPIADLNFVESVSQYDIPVAISHSFGFGGHNAGVLVKQYY